MKKITLALALMASVGFANAADALNGTVWKTIDDKTKQPKSLVKFTQNSNGTLNASIQSILTPGEENSCSKCEGKYKNKPLKGVTVVQNLKHAGGNKYEGGTILDPKTGMFKMSAEIAGNQLNVRGYIGISAIGRNQTWVRAN